MSAAERALTRQHRFTRQLVRGCCAFLALWAVSPTPSISAQGHSLRFYGHGVNDIDRVKIQLDAPPKPVDVGAGDFTIEWWMKALPGENGAGPCIGGGDTWINGNIVLDRDVYNSGDHGDYGVSVTNGRLAVGVNNGTSGHTICSATMIADGIWHHVAVTRRRSDGLLRMFIDGTLDAEADGPDGDVSYRDGRATPFEDDPFLVIAAEKHDVGAPGYSGWIDELRLSTTLRYAGPFTPPAAPFTADADTAALYHFEAQAAGACVGTVTDSAAAAGGPSNGTCNFGGTAPEGPVYSADTPFNLTPPATSTRTQPPAATSTRTATVTATRTSTPTRTLTPPPTATVTLRPTRSFTPTLTATAIPTATQTRSSTVAEDTRTPTSSPSLNASPTPSPPQPTATPSVTSTSTTAPITTPSPTRTPTATVTPGAAPGDLTGDGRVTEEDLTLLFAAIFLANPPNGADVNGDARVTSADITKLIGLLEPLPEAAVAGLIWHLTRELTAQRLREKTQMERDKLVELSRFSENSAGSNPSDA